MRVATNRCLSHIAARPPAADGLDAADGIADAMPRPDELAARLQTAARLQSAVRGLPLALRQVMVLAFEGLSNEEIAAVLGLTAGNVGVRLHRGKSMLKAALGEAT
jgi:RNA polymerase sigma-70 factor (ECF subfamily)